MPTSNNSTFALLTSLLEVYPQAARAVEIFCHKYAGVDLEPERQQYLNENPSFSDGLDKLIRQCSRIPTIPAGFQLLKQYPLTVPADYVHAGYLDRFREAHKAEFRYGYHEAITDLNYPNPSHMLVPGRTYLIKQYSILCQVSSKQCLEVYAHERAHKTGAQGTAMHWEQKRDELPVNKWALSFDEKDRLPLVGGCHRVPGVCRSSDGFRFVCGYFEFPWSDYYILVLFCDSPANGVATESSGA
ncbi:MAG: hypothetical protein AAB590_00735 [Patescibacteria group bacterium]